MELPAAYVDARDRVISLVVAADERQLDSMVPACPDWSVLDLLGHLIGACETFVTAGVPLGGNFPLTGFDDPSQARAAAEFNAPGVASRRGKGVASLVAEWEARTPAVLAVLEGFKPLPPGAPELARLAFVTDIAVHVNDLRGALGLPGDRDIPASGIFMAAWMGAIGLRLAQRQLAAISVAGQQVGEGPVGAVIDGDQYELLRAFSGRRSLRQMRLLFRDGQPGPYLPVLPLFAPPAADLAV